MKRTIILSVVFLMICGWLAAGTLEPSASPSPTMKTLDQVEARIPINPSGMPITLGDSGSYYLTGNYTAGSATYAIFISADYVTVDLNGYSLNGNSKLGKDAIQIDAGIKYTTIRNGYIYNWSGCGINGEEAERTYVEDIHVDLTTNEGIFLATAAKVIGCSATNCGEGFTLGSDSIAVRCTARNNTNNGFGTWGSCLLAECTASGNGAKDGLEKAQTPAQAEPRIPIPADSFAAETFTISQSGSYYLQGNRVCSGTGIQVDADDVTIDLMGYTLKGPDTGTNNGIFIVPAPGHTNVEIRNGIIRDFYNAIGNSGTNLRVIDVRAISNTLGGIVLSGTNNLVKNCTVYDNGTSATSNVYGISVGTAGMVTDNDIYNNGISATGTNVYGIHASLSSRIISNTVYHNGSSASGTVYGIYADDGSTLKNNTVQNNGASKTTGNIYGIYADSCSTVSNNTSSHNGNASSNTTIYGIYVDSNSSVVANTAGRNGSNTTGSTVYGFYIGSSSLVDQNTAAGNWGTNMFTDASCVLGQNAP